VAGNVAPGFASDDAVNERPPVTVQQREAHWGVDCAGLRRVILAWAAGRTGGGGQPTADWTGQLRLCAAIYNVPGDATALHCPDYAAALALLAAGGEPPRQQMEELLGCGE
jgi:hypothetical protein